MTPTHPVLVLGDLEIDLTSGAAARAGEEVSLTPKEVAILRHLSARTDEDVDRDELYAAVWGYGAGVVSRTLDTTIHRLRLKIEPNPAQPTWLRTVHGRGYRLVRSAARPARSRWTGRGPELRRIAELMELGPVLLYGAPGSGVSTVARMWAEGHPTARLVEGSDREEVLRALDEPGPLVVVDLPTDRAIVRAASTRREPTVAATTSAVGWSAGRVRVGGLLPGDAVELLVRAWRLAEDSPPPSLDVLRTLAESVDFVPVALEAVGRHAAAVGVAAVLDGIAVGLGPASPLCTRVRDRFEQAWLRLGATDRLVMTLVAEFGGAVSMTVVRDVLRDVEDLGGTMASLVDAGWLVSDDAGVVSCYWHVRSCVGRVSGAEERERCRLLRRAWAQAAIAATGDPERWMLSALQAELRAAREPLEVAALAEAVTAGLERRGAADGVQRVCEDAVRRATGDPVAEARLRLLRARHLQHVGDPRLVEDANRAIDLALPRERWDLVARALGLLATWHQARGSVAEADAALARSADIAERRGRWREHRYAQGLVLHARGDFGGAAAVLREAHVLAVRDGDAALARDALLKAAVVLADAGLLDESASTAEQCLRLGLASPAAEAVLHGTMGQVELQRGRFERAREHYAVCLRASRSAARPEGEAAGRVGLGVAALAEGDWDRAFEELEAALETWARHHSPMWLGLARSMLALAHHGAGERDVARLVARDAFEVLVDVAPRQAWRVRSWEALLAGERAGAEALEMAQAALARAEELQDAVGNALARSVLDRIHGRAALVAPPQPFGSILARLEP
ncbi:MAG: winged helix-turn-helix domain-containing protein [Alphaproteobacteria bacterium]|nr:winged helix-turn-helix domain-containing protein [Alphaproteobacteria bacterium]MCB9699085.1 winged helix-turn-helix domain-containing protein [Alphaproteobacteria bacterium]